MTTPEEYNLTAENDALRARVTELERNLYDEQIKLRQSQAQVALDGDMIDGLRARVAELEEKLSGYQSAETRTCPECNNPVQQQWTFCPRCGAGDHSDGDRVAELEADQAVARRERDRLCDHITALEARCATMADALKPLADLDDSLIGVTTDYVYAARAALAMQTAPPPPDSRTPRG
jgi:BMFP domain-containing protein YqiC